MTDCLLHTASMLTTTSSGGPTLPEPLLSLFLYLHKDQVSVKDHHGRLPLHCAMIHALPAAADDSSSSSKRFADPALVHFRQKQPMGQQAWIGKLLKENPAAGSGNRQPRPFASQLLAGRCCTHKLTRRRPCKSGTVAALPICHARRIHCHE